MISKIEKNYFLDIPLSIIGVVCIITGLIVHLKPQAFMTFFGMIKNLHIWAGYGLAVLVIIHVLWHFAWVQAMTNSIFKAPRKVWGAILCVALAVIFCTAAVLSAPPGKPQHAPSKVTMESMPKLGE